MAEEKKIIVDDDWKAEAQREKERLEQEAAQHGQPPTMTPFLELLNLIAMQAVVGLGGLTGPGGERIPPNLDAAKHFIDMLHVLEEKTKGNLTPEEATIIDQTLYELRMRYIQSASGGSVGPAVGGAPQS